MKFSSWPSLTPICTPAKLNLTASQMERRHPDWIKVRAPASPEYFRTRSLLSELKLHTVCQEACCPNIGECFGHRTATFMLMGDVCTRNCPYCAVTHGRVRPLDPAATAIAIKQSTSRTRIEVLVPDFRGARASVETVVRSPINIYNHNVETV